MVVVPPRPVGRSASAVPGWHWIVVAQAHASRSKRGPTMGLAKPAQDRRCRGAVGRLRAAHLIRERIGQLGAAESCATIELGQAAQTSTSADRTQACPQFADSQRLHALIGLHETDQPLLVECALSVWATDAPGDAEPRIALQRATGNHPRRWSPRGRSSLISRICSSTMWKLSSSHSAAGVIVCCAAPATTTARTRVLS